MNPAPDNASAPQSSSPFLSVITVCYNAIETLPQTVESVAGQSDNDLEHIVIDGGSTDGSVDFLRQLNLPHLSWISEKDNGIYNAMNKGVQMARGKMVAFLNADDCYFPHTLRTVRNAWQHDTDIVYGDLRKERFLNNRWFHRLEKPNLELMPQTMGIFHPATFIRRELFDQLGGYDEQYRLSADYEWLLRAFLSKAKFQYIPQPLAIFRVGGASTMDCRSYEEGLQILRQHQTGYDKQMEKLVRQCRKKVLSLRLIHLVTKITATGNLLQKKMSKNWIPNNGGFGS